MAIGVHVAYTNTAASTSVSTSSTGTRSTTTGSTIIAFLRAYSDDFHATVPILDSGSHTWTEVTPRPADTADGSHHRVYKAVNITGSGTHTFTMQLLSAAYGAIHVCEVKDVSSNPTVTWSSNEDSSSPFTSPSIAPTGACVLLGIFHADPSTTGNQSDTWGGSFASGDKIEEVTDSSNELPGSMAAAVKGSGGTYSSSVTSAGTRSPAIASALVGVLSVETAGGGNPAPGAGSAIYTGNSSPMNYTMTPRTA